jgi:uncharacterized membrane protein YozB (DUF420 family)
MTFFDTISFISTFTLIIQVLVFIMLVYGYDQKRKFRFRAHGKIMATAVVIHSFSIFLVMIPAFVISSFEDVLPKPIDLIFAGGIIHGIVGAVAFVLGVYLVATWRFKKDVKRCFTQKNLMLPTLAAWIIALGLGIVLYGVLYGSMLFG